MTSTLTRRVAKLVCKETGRGHMIFNDKLADGTRSLKVWGWDDLDYMQAFMLLEKFGFKPKLVKTPVKYDVRSGRMRRSTRIHVNETNLIG
jgi:hypothetical protein